MHIFLFKEGHEKNIIHPPEGCTYEVSISFFGWFDIPSLKDTFSGPNSHIGLTVI